MTGMLDINQTKQGANVSICTELTIYSAAQLKDELLTLLRASPVVNVNLAQVNDIDTSGLQILIMLKNEAQILSHEVNFIEHSASVLSVIELMNMVSFFGDPLVLPR